MKNRLVFLVVFLMISVALPAHADVAAAGQEAEDVERGGLSGFVCGPQGEPVPRAVVLVNMRKTTTAEDGSFFIPHKELEGQGPTLIVLVTGELDGTTLRCARFVDYVTQKENVTIRLSRSGSIAGHVLTPDGTPIAGAKVSALMNVGHLTCHGTHPVGQAVETDENGQFVLSDLYPEMRYRLRASSPERERKMTDWIAVGERELCDRLAIVLREAPGFVAGRVVDEDGNAVANARVILGHPCIPDAASVTDEEGAFRIADLLPDEEVTLCVGWDFQKAKAGTEDLVLVVRDRREWVNKGDKSN